jgi:hypothetical protein
MQDSLASSPVPHPPFEYDGDVLPAPQYWREALAEGMPMYMTRLEHWKAIREMEQRLSTSSEPIDGLSPGTFRHLAESVPLLPTPSSRPHPDVTRLQLLAYAQSSIQDKPLLEGSSASGTFAEFFDGGASFLKDILSTAQQHAAQTMRSTVADEDMAAPLLSLIQDLEVGSVFV